MTSGLLYFVPSLLPSIFAPSYFNLGVSLFKCSGEHSCMSSTFSKAILSLTCCFRTAKSDSFWNRNVVQLNLVIRHTPCNSENIHNNSLFLLYLIIVIFIYCYGNVEVDTRCMTFTLYRIQHRTVHIPWLVDSCACRKSRLIKGNELSYATGSLNAGSPAFGGAYEFGQLGTGLSRFR